MNLSKKEKFFLKRRRTNKSRKDVALEYAVDEGTITSWEKGYNKNVPDVQIEEELTTAERCLILRRRINLSMMNMGEILGVSATTIHLIENGKHGPKLMVEYFNERNSS